MGRKMKNWIIFFKVVSWSILLPYQLVLSSTQTILIAFQRHIKIMGYQMREISEIVFVDVFDEEACDCESQKYLFL